MTEGPREERRFSLSPAWAAIGLSLMTAFWQVAVTSASVADNKRRIEVLENTDRIRGDALGRIDARTARIEATLEMMRGTYRPLSAPITPSSDAP